MSRQHGGAQILHFLPRFAERGFQPPAHHSNRGCGRFRTWANLLGHAVQLERNAGQGLQQGVVEFSCDARIVATEPLIDRLPQRARLSSLVAWTSLRRKLAPIAPGPEG